MRLQFICWLQLATTSVEHDSEEKNTAGGREIEGTQEAHPSQGTQDSDTPWKQAEGETTEREHLRRKEGEVQEWSQAEAAESLQNSSKDKAKVKQAKP